jgi:polysaccharide export outer membrane protein
MKTKMLSAIALVLLASPLAAAQASSGDDKLVLEARPVTEGTMFPPSLPRVRSDYRIGRQDLLEISVFDVDELDQTVRVGDDGSITMPLLGRMDVSGLTKTELEQTIASLLAERYVRDPQVTVFVKEYTSKQIAVSGAVKKPGTYEMLGSKTLLEMISMAGGLGTDIGKQIVIFRQTGEGVTERLPIDLDRLIYDADPALNVAVEPNDIIYIPAIAKARIFVSGAVKTPDLYEVPRDEPITLLKAITLAGGTTDRAADKKVRIMRTEDDGSRVTLVVNLRHIKRGKAEDPVLQPDDIVLVPEAFF